MNKIKNIFFILIIFLLLNFNNQSFAQNVYVENLKFKALYKVVQLIPNPVQKISLLNSLADINFQGYTKAKNINQKKLFLENYLTTLKDLEKTWSKFSFNYSEYPKLYENSLELYVKYLKENSEKIKNQEVQIYLVKIITKISQRLDNKEGVVLLNNLISKYKITNFPNYAVFYKEIQSENIETYNELLDILNELKNLVDEFEKGQRVIVNDHKGVENKILELQNEANLAMENIRKMKLEDFKKNIIKLKELIEFLKKNSKKIK